jgi:hypothetical protein
MNRWRPNPDHGPIHHPSSRTGPPDATWATAPGDRMGRTTPDLRARRVNGAQSTPTHRPSSPHGTQAPDPPPQLPARDPRARPPDPPPQLPT